MLARACACPRPRVFADSPEACHRCGRDVRAAVSPSTQRLAVAIAEVLLGKRRIGTPAGHAGGRRKAAG